MVRRFPVCRDKILAAEQLVYCVTGLINPASDYEACGQVFTETGGEKKETAEHGGLKNSTTNVLKHFYIKALGIQIQSAVVASTETSAAGYWRENELVARCIEESLNLGLRVVLIFFVEHAPPLSGGGKITGNDRQDGCSAYLLRNKRWT